MKYVKQFIYFVCISSLGYGLSACDLEKDIEVSLPSSGPNLVVESYVESGRPLQVLLTESSGYFADLEPRLVNDAEVTVSVNGDKVVLEQGIYLDQRSGKFYNYASKIANLYPTGTELSLSIKSKDGRELNGKTSILPIVPIDTASQFIVSDSTVIANALFKDKVDEKNFYRIQIINISRRRPTSTEFEFTDELFNGQQIPIQSRVRGSVGDTLSIRLFHIAEDYYNFLQSVQSASSANGNPFAQPVVIRSTVNGGIGVFTSLSYDTRQVIIR